MAYRSAGRGFGTAPNVKMPANPKYSKARTKLDTGPNMRKIIEAAQGSPLHAHKKQKNEFFVRLRPVTLGRLLEPLVEQEESVYALGREDTQSVISSVVPDSVAGGGSSEGGNLLIFDLRDFSEFEQCHVYGARHLEVAMLNRSTNNFPREVYFYKGPIDHDKMIVLYDEDGKTAPQVGNLFVERGVENTYCVSAGFLGLCATCPHILVGHPPSPETLATLMSRAGIKPHGSGGTATSVRGAGRLSTAGAGRTQNTNLLSSIGGMSPQKIWK